MNYISIARYEWHACAVVYRPMHWGARTTVVVTSLHAVHGSDLAINGVAIPDYCATAVYYYYYYYYYCYCCNCFYYYFFFTMLLL